MSWLKRGFSLAFIQALVTRHLRITISRARLLQSLLVSRLVCCLSVADGKGTIHKQARNLPSCNHTYNFSRNHLSTDLNRRSRAVSRNSDTPWQAPFWVLSPRYPQWSRRQPSYLVRTRSGVLFTSYLVAVMSGHGKCGRHIEKDERMPMEAKTCLQRKPAAYYVIFLWRLTNSFAVTCFWLVCQTCRDSSALPIKSRVKCQ